LSDRPFYAPQSTHNPRRFHFAVEGPALVGPPERPFMMGGVGLGSAIEALEQATGRPLIWATAQYLSFAGPGQIVDIDVHVPVVGKSVTQARVVSHVGEREIITVNAALGKKEGKPTEQFVEMPRVPPPEECPKHLPHGRTPGDLNSILDRRLVTGDEVDHAGHARMWVRTTRDEAITPGLLAVFADFLAGALPVTTGSSSLDNTLRIVDLKPTRWCLLDTRVQALASGFFHGEMCLFAEDGTLLAMGNQSGVLPRKPLI